MCRITFYLLRGYRQQVLIFILIYCDFTYLLTPDVVCIIDRRRPKENAVKVIVEAYDKRHTFFNKIFSQLVATNSSQKTTLAKLVYFQKLKTLVSYLKLMFKLN